MKHYTIGFLFDSTHMRVLLQRKTHPAWQAGKLNGVGGKVEEGETPLVTMIREFHEEVSGITIHDWHYFCEIRNTKMGYALHCFWANGEIDKCKAKEDEPVAPYLASYVGVREDLIYHVSWLLEMIKIASKTGMLYRVQEINDHGWGPLQES